MFVFVVLQYIARVCCITVYRPCLLNDMHITDHQLKTHPKSDSCGHSVLSQPFSSFMFCQLVTLVDILCSVNHSVVLYVLPVSDSCGYSVLSQPFSSFMFCQLVTLVDILCSVNHSVVLCFAS